MIAVDAKPEYGRSDCVEQAAAEPDLGCQQHRTPRESLMLRARLYSWSQAVDPS